MAEVEVGARHDPAVGMSDGVWRDAPPEGQFHDPFDLEDDAARARWRSLREAPVPVRLMLCLVMAGALGLGLAVSLALDGPGWRLALWAGPVLLLLSGLTLAMVREAGALGPEPDGTTGLSGATRLLLGLFAWMWAAGLAVVVPGLSEGAVPVFVLVIALTAGLMGLCAVWDRFAGASLIAPTALVCTWRYASDWAHDLTGLAACAILLFAAAAGAALSRKP